MARYYSSSEQNYEYKYGACADADAEKRLGYPLSPNLPNFNESLPIWRHKDQLLQTVKNNQVVIIKGETGSGKTTQITQYLFDAGYANALKGKIGCTQPRRVAAKTVAQRVANEVGTELGNLVGYKIRFDKKVCENTFIVYMTDGVLLRELCSDPYARPYSVIMLDEAHERNIDTDVVMGLLKRILCKRKDLKLLVTSATMDAIKFSEYFDNAPVVSISGRGHPVQIIYSSNDLSALVKTIHLSIDPMIDALNMVEKIHAEEEPGDILVFLTGQDEIEEAVEELASSEGLLPLPLYSALPAEKQNAVFQPAPEGLRKVILATNIAETSVTIDGIVYVVDTGYVKEKEYNPNTGIANLVVKHISQAQAIQRAGRAGRTQPGKVYRLYLESQFNSMDPLPIPEIQRMNVESIILQLVSIGITDILEFPFLDAPSIQTIKSGLATLEDLDAIEIHKNQAALTPIGREMSQFPLDPSLAKVLIKSQELGCSEEMLTIVALLSTQCQNIFYRPKKEKKKESEKARPISHMNFHTGHGDLITMLNIYNQWVKNHRSKEWCYQAQVFSRTLEEADEIRTQLKHLLAKRNFKMISCKDDYTKVQVAICSGFYRNVAMRVDRHFHGSRHAASYITYSSSLSTREYVFIHPSSSILSGSQPGPSTPSWVIYHQVIKTSSNKAHMRQVTPILPIWLKEQSGNFFKKLVRTFPELSPADAQVPLQSELPCFTPYESVARNFGSQSFQIGSAAESHSSKPEASQNESPRLRISQTTNVNSSISESANDESAIQQGPESQSTSSAAESPTQCTRFPIPRSGFRPRVNLGAFKEENSFHHNPYSNVKRK